MITYELLQSKGACEGQLKLFKKTFHNGVEVTIEECVKYAEVFDFKWASKNLLVDQEAYEEADEPLWKAYEEAEAPLWKAYEEANAPLFKAYEEGLAKAFAEQYIKESKL